MKKPRLVVANWAAGVAVEWKCSCNRWRMELPSDSVRPQAKAAMIHSAFNRHLASTHTATNAAAKDRVAR